jgi:hexosaminidase
MQLLPEASETKGVSGIKWTLPCLKIEDYPQFQWRGLMVDVSRHFFSKDVVKAYINQMSKYKLNTFHFHLTDNQGWRIEIKSLPELTRVGAWRVPRTGYWNGHKAPEQGEAATYGGYYSQDDIREIVQFAAERFVTVVPEIDVPGHSLALIASYPELSCTKQPQQVLAGDPWNTSRTNVLCAGNDSTYHALDKIITEVASLFPGEYIHIGGDEVQRIYWEKCNVCRQRIINEKLKNSEELQTYFTKRLAKIVESKGKKVMGWYEALEGGLAPGIAVMSWKSYAGGITASQAGHKVVMTPAPKTYLDYFQNEIQFENGPYPRLRLISTYTFDPLPQGVRAENVLGGQGSLWTEHVPNERRLQYQTWPRGMALAEVLWSPKDKRIWDDFVLRMESQLPRFDSAGVKYATSFYEPMITAVKGKDSTMLLNFTTEIKGLDVHYSFDDTSPDAFYSKYENKPLLIPKGAQRIRAISYRNGKPAGREVKFLLSDLEKQIKK